MAQNALAEQRGAAIQFQVQEKTVWLIMSDPDAEVGVKPRNDNAATIWMDGAREENGGRRTCDNPLTKRFFVIATDTSSPALASR